MRPAPVLALLLATALLPLAAPGAALARHRPMSARTPTFEVSARRNREVCTFVPLPAGHAMDVGEVVIANHGANEHFTSHHVILYGYTGRLETLSRYRGQVVDDTACLNLGTGDPALLHLIATSQSLTSKQRMPHGTALRLEPGVLDGRHVIGLVINSHWINSSDETQRARVKVKLIPARGRTVKPLQPIFEVVANAFLDVPPGEVRQVGWNWGPGLPSFGANLGGSANPTGPACVTMLIGHMHRRGTLFTADLVDAAGHGTELYRNERYSDPPALPLDPPLLVSVGESISYQCTHDNATDPKLGCEEQPGVVPGRSIMETLPNFLGEAAKSCSAAGPDPEECPPSDPRYPDRTFTGNCVQANLVFGFTSEDDMCILPGYFYPAALDAAPGHECDL
jgi:hypothetical protein